MFSLSSLFSQLKSIIPVLLKVLLPALMILLGIALISDHTSLRIRDMTRDPLQVLGGHPLIGVLSNLGMILWVATITICLFCSFLIRSSKSSSLHVSFLRWGALITALLFIDDLFLMHDVIFPTYLGIKDKFFYLGYGVLVGIFFLKNYKLILETDYLYMAFALLFFFLSISVDMLVEPDQLLGMFLYEDGFKLLGITCWSTYFILTGWNYVRLTHQKASSHLQVREKVVA